MDHREDAAVYGNPKFPGKAPWEPRCTLGNAGSAPVQESLQALAVACVSTLGETLSYTRDMERRLLGKQENPQPAGAPVSIQDESVRYLLVILLEGLREQAAKLEGLARGI